MGNKAHIKIDKVIKYCSECPFCSIQCTGYGKSGCYEHDVFCHAINTKFVYRNLRFVDIFQKSLWGCGAVVCIVDQLYFIGEDDGHWFLREGKDINLPRNLYGFATSFSIGWIESFTNALNTLNEYVKENGIPVYYSGLAKKIVCYYRLGKPETEE